MERNASDAGGADVDAPSRPDPLVGTIVNGKFHVRSSIARGGMGRIYFATQVPLDRPVALKVVQADGDREHESQFLKRFLQEASILAKLQHPNVVTLFDYGRIEGSTVERYFIAMEYLDGETLAHRLASRAPLPATEVLVLFRQIARGLREAHARGIVHRDLKPSNIILVPQGDGGELVKIVDFGIGKLLERGPGGDDLTQDGMMVGTPKYMAPEQFEGTASPASDLYSLGTILYQAVTGRLPFQGGTLAEFMVAKFAHPIPRFREVLRGTDASERLEMLVLRLLARAPEERPSLDEIFSQLAACEEETFGTSQGRRMATGGYAAAMLSSTGSVTPAPMVPPPSASYPQMPGATPSPSVAPRVPYPLVSANPPTLMLTPRPMATTTPPASLAPPASSAQKGALVAAAAVALLLVGGGALYLLRGAGPTAAGPSARTRGLASTAGAGDTGGAGAGALDPAAGSFVLNVETTPPGASVLEGDVLVGVTPAQIKIERSSVSREPRTFVVRKDGYVQSTLVQGPSATDVRSVVTLAADLQPARARSGSGARPASTGRTTPPTPPTPNPDSDIRLKR